MQYSITIDDVTQWRKHSRPNTGAAYRITPTAAVKGLIGQWRTPALLIFKSASSLFSRRWNLLFASREIIEMNKVNCVVNGRPASSATLAGCSTLPLTPHPLRRSTVEVDRAEGRLTISVRFHVGLSLLLLQRRREWMGNSKRRWPSWSDYWN